MHSGEKQIKNPKYLSQRLQEFQEEREQKRR